MQWHSAAMMAFDEALTRGAASEAVEAIGWRYALGTLVTSVPVQSLDESALVGASAITACREQADGHLRVDLRPDRVELSLQTRSLAAVTSQDTELASRITQALAAAARRTAGATSAELPRPVQMLELAIDALDIPAIRPFWKAVLAYADEPGHDGPTDPSWTPPGSSPPSGSSRWTRHGLSATVSISTSP